MKINPIEYWEKVLGFLAFDWVAVESNGESITANFMSMYGEIYFQKTFSEISEARDFLSSCKFQLFVPTPERMEFRNPTQLSQFTISELQQPDRIYLEPD